MDMLVDHYPLRAAVESFDASQETPIQSLRLLAEAMAGSEVLLAVEANGSTKFSPLIFNIDDTVYLVAGTSAEYAEKEFMSYLAERVVHGEIEMRAVDARELVRVAITLGNVNAILFDMEVPVEPEMFGMSLLRSSLIINDLVRRVMTDPTKLLESDDDEELLTLPPNILGMLAREDSEDEQQQILFDYLSRCSRDELQRTIVFIGMDENGEDSTYTTLARGFVARLKWYTEKTEIGEVPETFTLINVWTWLNSLVEQPDAYFRLDSIILDNIFAQRVISAVDSI